MLDQNKFFFGYASVFNKVDLNRDIILKDSFRFKNAAEIPLLLEHNKKNRIGTIISLSQNERGLFVEGFILKHFSKREIKLSVGYEVRGSVLQKNGVRVLFCLDLIEISVVKNPANKFALAVCA